jgi:hypothetical protein
MSEAPCANFELSVVLPLGVIANQLMKLEADLRFLNAKTSSCAREPPSGDVAGQVAARLEKINSAIEAIRTLVADIETDIQPRHAGTKSLKARTDRDD